MASQQTKRLAENVAFLSILNPTPSLPSSNATPAAANTTGPVRILSFERERSLASGLAFLSGISNGSNHVTALCVEEQPGKDGITLVLAINKAQPPEEENMLKTIQQGLQGIVDLLSTIRQDSDRYKIEWDLIRTVVLFCRTRILQRIGSARAQQGKKKPAILGGTLSTVTKAVTRRLQNGMLRKPDRMDAEKFIQRLNYLRLLLEELEVCPSSDIDLKLEQIIHAADKLNLAIPLPRFLQNFSNQELDPGILEGVVRRTEKLARYYGFSRRLYQTAKNTKLFRHAKVTIVSLPPNCFSRPQNSMPDCSLDGCLARCSLLKVFKAPLLRNLEMTAGEAIDGMKALATKTVNESKIHAEIQMLAHYELNPAKLPPRVIASSKDACYLCNEAVRLHGMYQVPSSHGRLYPGWRLATLPVFVSLCEQLNQVLETRATELCRRIVASNRKQFRGYPNESRIFAFSTSMSAIPSLTNLQLQLQPPITVQKPICDETTTVDERLSATAIRKDVMAVEPSNMRLRKERTDSGYASMTISDEDPAPLPPDNIAAIPLSNDQQLLHDATPRGSATDLGSKQNSVSADNANEISLPNPDDQSSSARRFDAKGASSWAISNRTSSAILRTPEQDPEPVLTNEAVILEAKRGVATETQTYNVTPLASEHAPAVGRKSAVTLRKGVVVQCRLTDYTSFRAGQLMIVPELVPKNKVSSKGQIAKSGWSGWRMSSLQVLSRMPCHLVPSRRWTRQIAFTSDMKAWLSGWTSPGFEDDAVMLGCLYGLDLVH